MAPLPEGGEELVAPRLEREREVQRMVHLRRNNPGQNPGPPAIVLPGLEPGGRPEAGGRTKKKKNDRGKGRLMASPSVERCPGSGLSTRMGAPEGGYG